MTVAVVLGAPTGPTGNVQGVNIFANITGASGQYRQWTQATGATGTHGQFKRVYNIGPSGVKSEHKTIIIPGYKGPTGS